MSYADIRSMKKSSSRLISDGMKQLHTDEILGQVLTVTDVDVMNGRNGECGVITFAEYPESFYFTGKVLREMCEQFLADDAAMEEMHAGKVRITISRKKSETSGRDYITFEYVTDETEAADLPFDNK